MAAAHQLSGRLCACGCQRSLEGLHQNTMYSPECIAARRKTRKQQTHKQMMARRAASRKEREACRSLNPRSHVVTPGPGGVPGHLPQEQCDVCANMPWARTPDRYIDERNGHRCRPMAVAKFTVRGWACKGCGELYAPEPRPEAPVLQSSAGYLADHGTLHGTSGNKPGQGEFGMIKDLTKAKG